MKKIMLCAICISVTLASDAQSLKKYIQLNAGGYTADQRLGNIPYPDYDRYGFGPGYSGGIAAGIVKGRWKLELGVHHLTLLEQRKGKQTFGQLDPLTGTITSSSEAEVKMSERYRHIMVPLTVSYNLVKPGEKWSLSPSVGVAYSYNYKHEIRIQGVPGENEDWKETSYLGNELVQNSLWGHAGIEAGYNITPRLMFIAAPQVSYMLTSFISREKSNFTQHTLMIGGNIGIRYLFR